MTGPIDAAPAGAAAAPDTPGSDRVLARLMALHPKRIDLVLDRVHRLLAALGHPERALPPVFHVAGTNGKGSVCANLRAMLEASGARVHVYTSPHLVRFHERIRLAGGLISEDALLALLEECEAANGDAPITFFEITTAAAFLAFSRTPADALVLEVGLGGRLDATNVVDRPLVTVITPVSYDHQAFLGDTLAQIAGEKAGILKPGVPAIVAAQEPDAMRAIEKRARQVGAPLTVEGRDFEVREEGGRMVYEDASGLLDLPRPRLPGHHQVSNAGLAIAALRAQDRFALPTRAYERGLVRVEWPARLQRLTRGPLVETLTSDDEVWLDGGHNPAAGAALAGEMAAMEDARPMPLHLVVGMINTKDVGGFLAPFSGLARTVTAVTIPGEEAAVPAADIAAAALALGFTTRTADSVDDALRRRARDGNDPQRVLLCGSLYLAGQILRANS